MKFRKRGPFSAMTIDGRVMEVGIGKLYWYPWRSFRWQPNPKWRVNPWTGK